jgi:hypothetical protein
MPAARALERRAGEAREDPPLAEEARERGHERRRDDQRPRAERRRDVVVRRVDRDREARRQRPRRRRPDRGGGRVEPRERRGQRRDERIGDVHRRRAIVLILDLGLGERGRARRAPEDGFLPAIDEAVADAASERADLFGFVAAIGRDIRVRPVAEHAEAAELAALDIDEVVGVGAAAGADLDLRQGLLLRAPELLLDVQLDRQAVAVPARHVRREPARHRAVLHDDVLQHLVERRAEMDVAVRVRRPVVKDEARLPGVLLEEALVHAPGRPPFDHRRLALREVRLHRELGARQVERRLVVHRGPRHATSGIAGFQRDARGANATSARSTAAARLSPTGFGNTIVSAAPAMR